MNSKASLYGPLRKQVIVFCWQVRRSISKTNGGHFALVGLRDTSYAVAVGVLRQLCNGWVSYPSRRRRHCSNSQPHAEKMFFSLP